MKKILYILGELEDDDAEWLSRAGTPRSMGPGEVLIREGQAIESVFFVIGGQFFVTTGPGEQEVARVGVGEVLGEVSYVDRNPPTATVTAAQDSRVLAVDRALLTQKLEEDPAFAARFYRAIALFLASRLRSTLLKVGAEGRSGEMDYEMDLEALDSASKAGVRFERILQQLQQL